MTDMHSEEADYQAVWLKNWCKQHEQDDRDNEGSIDQRVADIDPRIREGVVYWQDGQGWRRHTNWKLALSVTMAFIQNGDE